MLKIGITGGIGSGKSLVARIFEVLGIPVYYADREAKRIMHEDAALVSAIRNHFGSAAYDSSGQLDRAYLAERVFSDPDQLRVLNSLVHPATIRDSELWAERQRAPYVMKEAALMFETESFHHMDRVLGVSAPEALRILRTMRRDQVSRPEVLRRMSQQLDERVKMRLCDYVIRNDEVRPVLPQVLELHRRFLELSGAKGAQAFRGDKPSA
jgi:dephospho-CoA kinase